MADTTHKKVIKKINEIQDKIIELDNQTDFIQLKKDNILRIGIRDSEGKPTGEHLEFDLESVEYPLKLNKCEAMHRKNFYDLNAQLTIINKRQDKKGKYLLSYNEEEEIKAYKQFCENEMKAIDLFLGEGGSKKLLNGREPYYTFFNDFVEIIEPILPKLKVRSEDIKKSIIEKYKNKSSEEIEVLK